MLLGASSLGVYHSQNGGTDFERSSTGISELDLYSVHVNPANPSEIAMAVQASTRRRLLPPDGGVNWLLKPVPPTRYSAMRFSPGGVL